VAVIFYAHTSSHYFSKTRNYIIDRLKAFYLSASTIRHNSDTHFEVNCSLETFT